MPPKQYYKKKIGSNGPASSTNKAKPAFNLSQYAGAKYLVIVESPSKCNKIEHYLGHDYKCIASKGHIREIVGLKNIDTKHNFHPTFTIIDEKAEHVKQMQQVIDQFTKPNILVASDDDREGEAIAWHICQVFGLPIETTKRIIFHEITQPAILVAVAAPLRINMNLVHAQHARQVLDMVVGFKVSPLLWRHVCGGSKQALSAGRCQTPALRLVYDNEQEKIGGGNEGKGLEMRYKTVGHFFPAHPMDFELNYEFEDKIAVQSFLDKSKTHSHELTIGLAKPTTKSPPSPFNTSRLLQVASNVLHSSPKHTMMTCQTLYQNGHITYMRTENSKYAPTFLDIMRKFIPKEYGSDEYIGQQIDSLSNASTDGSGDNPHEAIRVTNVHMSTLPDNADPGDGAMYRLIWRNTVESCMADARYLATTAKISSPGKLENDKPMTYSHILEIPTFLGWKKVQSKIQSDSIPSSKTNEPSNSPEAQLLFLKSLSKATMANVPYSSIESTVVVRNKHSHYTEASLIQTLEELGIGRPSTFASLVDTVQDRGYVKCTDVKGTTHNCIDFKLLSGGILDTIETKKVFGQEKNKLVIQPIGTLCVEFLIEHFNRLFSYDYTKKMEDDLDKIAQFAGPDSNTNPWYELCRSCYLEIQDLAKEVSDIKKPAYQLDDEHELLIQKFGPAIKHTNPTDGTITYKPVKTGLDIDLEKAKTGHYKLEDLLAFDNECLGLYRGNPVKLKVGKYGPYLEVETQIDGSSSVKRYGLADSLTAKNITLDQIDIEFATEFLDNMLVSNGPDVDNTDNDKNSRSPPPPPNQNKAILRVINSDMSIRSGKFGPYVYYKTVEMKSPKFLALKKFPHKYDTCDLSILEKWIQTTYLG